MGQEFWNRVQYGAESPAARGTPVACTRLFGGQMQPIKTDRKPKYPKESFGIRAESFRTLIGQYLYQNTLSVEDGAFEHLPLLFGGGIKGAVTAVETTPAQADYAWDFTPSLTALNNPDSFTLRMGDDAQAWIAEYCMFDSIRISGNVGQGNELSPVKLEGSFFGRQLQPTTFTAALAAPPLESMNAKLAQLYMDPTWASVGSTELANLLRAFDIQILTGLHPRFEGSIAKTFNAHGEGLLAIMGTFTLEGGSNANAIFAAQQAGTFKAMRLKITGSQIGTGTSHSFTLDFGGSFEDATPISGAERGDNQSTMVIHGIYDPTGAKLFIPKVTTNINAY